MAGRLTLLRQRAERSEGSGRLTLLRQRAERSEGSGRPTLLRQRVERSEGSGRPTLLRQRVLLALVGGLLALGATVPLSEVVQLPPSYEAVPLPGNAAWLDAIDPSLGAWVTDAAAVRPPGLPGRGGGVVLSHGVRFDTAAHARAAWEAIRAADADGGRRYDVEGFGDVHAHRDPLMAGTALVEYVRLAGRDVVVVQVRVDGPEEVSDHAREVLAWQAGRGAGVSVDRAVAVAVLAAAGAGAVWTVWRRRSSG